MLARSEMDFHISDAKLRLELAKQYPDLKIGFISEDDEGEKENTLSIPFSIELPVFGRNKQSIAMAFSQRRVKVSAYMEKLNYLISRLETLHAQYLLCFQKLRLHQRRLLPLAQKNTKDAEKSLKLGAMRPLRYLDLLADLQKKNFEKVQLETKCWQKLLEIESLIGLPLIHLGKKSLGPLPKN
ncbi:MAG: TolC family protein [Lentisphaeria bacterium]|nr:TolC family protein [Lentisphaeria bacterium]NQZ69250.1 TolC family protein [Lentisphaeria bacterium]